MNFRDDFDSFDPERWTISEDKTRVHLSSTFIEDNAYFEDGHLVLKMCKNHDHKPDFHVLPPPKDGTLDAAIEKATRAAVTMVRQQLENFSYSMSFDY